MSVVPLDNSALSADESVDLRKCEALIERSASNIADAYERIRDHRLYRVTHSNFEDYCQERWGVTRQQIHNIITAGQIRRALSNNVLQPPIPANDRQANALAPIADDPDAMAQAMAEVHEEAELEGTKVTAAAITEKVTEIKERTYTVPVDKETGEIMAGPLDDLLTAGAAAAKAAAPKKKQSGAVRNRAGKRYPTRADADQVRAAIATLTGIAAGLEALGLEHNPLEKDEAAVASGDLVNALRVLRHLLRVLKEIRQ